MCMHEQWWLHCTSQWGQCMILSEHVYCVAITFKTTKRVEQQICIKFFFKLEHCSTAMGDRWWELHHNNMPAHVSHLVQRFLVKHQVTLVTQPHYYPDLAPCDFWLLLKPQSLLKGKRFQSIDEIQENMMGQLIANGRTVWGPKVPTLRGTEALFFYVESFLHLVSSTINVSIFHSTWLDTFWTDLE